MKSARLSGLAFCCCCPASSACSPALRFFARFLLLALVEAFGAVVTSAPLAELELRIIPTAFALAAPALRREAGAGGVKPTLVGRSQRLHRMTFVKVLAD